MVAKNSNELISLNPDEFLTIKSPLTGTVYTKKIRSYKTVSDDEYCFWGEVPDEFYGELYVNIGDRVTKGQVICAIEAMMITNLIESEHEGIVTKIHIDNGMFVNCDQIMYTMIIC